MQITELAVQVAVFTGFPSDTYYSHSGIGIGHAVVSTGCHADAPAGISHTKVALLAGTRGEGSG